MSAYAFEGVKVMTLKQVAEKYGLTQDGVDYVLNQYGIVISEITHGLLSKLTYDAYDVIQCAQERWCETCELAKAQEPRLVTIDDFEGADEFGWLPAWCEEYAGAVYCECILVDALKEKGIRYWTRKPTDEQREAIPWNAQK